MKTAQLVPMCREEQIAFLRAHSSSTPSKWREKAEWRRMGCSPQYVSRLLKGEENLSLETICKLENALNLSILQTVLD